MKLKNTNLYFHNLLVPVYLVKKLYRLVPAYTKDDYSSKLNLFQYIQKDGTSINLPTYEEVFEWFRNRGFYFDIRYNFEENETCNSNDDINWYFYELWIDDGDEGIIEKKYYKSYKQAREHLLNRIIETCAEKYK